MVEQQKVLFQVDVEIELARDKRISEMFKNDDLGKDMVMFLLQNNVNLVEPLRRADGVVTRVSLRGAPDGLQKFVDTYFTADESPVAYNRLYR